MAFNRPVGDFNAGLTYLDQTLGIEMSAVGGLEVNGVNRATQYRSGDGLHLDLSATKFLTKEFSIGVIASHYQQITADGGSGDNVGPYRGRVTAVGGTVGFNFEVGTIPVTTRFKLLREVEINNRFKGTSGFAELSFPLWSLRKLQQKRPRSFAQSIDL